MQAVSSRRTRSNTQTAPERVEVSNHPASALNGVYNWSGDHYERKKVVLYRADTGKWFLTSLESFQAKTTTGFAFSKDTDRTYPTTVSVWMVTDKNKKRAVIPMIVNEVSSNAPGQL